MSEMKNFKVDFVDRTLSIIRNNDVRTEYDVTLLLNCLLGMITLPIELFKDEKSKSKVEDYKINCILKLKSFVLPKKIDKRDEEAFRHIRNSIAHLELEPKNENGVISSIRFKDKNEKGTVVLDFTIEVGKLKEFAIYVAEEYLKIIR